MLNDPNWSFVFYVIVTGDYGMAATIYVDRIQVNNKNSDNSDSLTSRKVMGLIFCPDSQHYATTKEATNRYMVNCSTSEHFHPNSEEFMVP